MNALVIYDTTLGDTQQIVQVKDLCNLFGRTDFPPCSKCWKYER